MLKNDQKKIDVGFLFSNPAHLIALGFGSGLAPVAPGTFGTLAAIPCWLLLVQLGFVWQLTVVGVAFAIGIRVCETTCRNLGVHDHGGVVWDEFVGLWITLMFAAFSWQNLVLGFLLFRAFDIVKPFPIQWLDSKVHGGIGVMLDDVVAGIFAGVCLFLINYLFS